MMASFLRTRTLSDAGALDRRLHTSPRAPMDTVSGRALPVIRCLRRICAPNRSWITSTRSRTSRPSVLANFGAARRPRIHLTAPTRRAHRPPNPRSTTSTSVRVLTNISSSATPSNSLGEHPEKVLRRTGLARADWNEPAAVTALVRNVPRQTVVALARRLQETPGPQGPRRLARPNSFVVLFYWCLFSSDFSVQGC